MSHADELPEVEGYGRLQVYVSALIGIVVALGLVWVVSGGDVFYEELFRIGPTAGGANAGVGADWVAGNTIPWLDALVAITHAADVLMGAFILVMVFLHWAAFHRLAARMRQPGETGEEAVMTDGGEGSDRSSSESRSRPDGGEGGEASGGERR
ncbi:MAG: hypothetical protein ABEJ05_03550 [Haloglomus sp.]